MLESITAVLVICFGVLGMLDFVTTRLGIKLGAREKNSCVDWIIEKFGMNVFAGLKVAVTWAVIVSLYYSFSYFSRFYNLPILLYLVMMIGLVICIVYGSVVWNNIEVIRKMRRME